MRYLISSILLLLLASCNAGKTEHAAEAKDSGKLSVKLVSNPYSANGLDTAVMAGKAEMSFIDTAHTFGDIREGEKVQYDFHFKNTGAAPLIISSATGTCGCTIADFPKEPLPPGKESDITVSFDATDKFGRQDKGVTIITNTKKGIEHLYITANVLTDKKKK